MATLALAGAGAVCDPSPAAAQEHGVRLTPFIEQRSVFFTSPHVSTGGFGGGVGLEGLWSQHWAVEVHADQLWGIGNVVSAQFAFGVQDSGFWQPGVRVVATTMWGDRIEVLHDDGRRPAIPSWALGLRAVPLRFSGDGGFASACEAGIGSDFNQGIALELTVFRAGARW